MGGPALRLRALQTFRRQGTLINTGDEFDVDDPEEAASMLANEFAVDPNEPEPLRTLRGHVGASAT